MQSVAGLSVNLFPLVSPSARRTGRQAGMLDSLESFSPSLVLSVRLSVGQLVSQSKFNWVDDAVS